MTGLFLLLELILPHESYAYLFPSQDACKWNLDTICHLRCDLRPCWELQPYRADYREEMTRLDVMENVWSRALAVATAVRRMGGDGIVPWERSTPELERFRLRVALLRLRMLIGEDNWRRGEVPLP